MINKKTVTNFKLDKFFPFLTIPFLSSATLSACGLFNHARTGLKIAIPFTLENTRTIAVKNLAAQYNQWIADNNKKNEGYLPIDDVYNSTNYGNNTIQLLNQLSNKDYDSLPNLSIGYASNIYDLAFNGNYLLDFSKSTNQAYNNSSSANNYTDDQIDPTIFSNAFLTMNKIIDITDPNGLYLVPSGSSVEALYVNRIVLNYLLKNVLTSDKVTIKNDAVDFFKKQFGIEKSTTSTVSNTQTDYSVIDTKTNAAKAAYGNVDISSITEKIELSTSMFETYEDFFQLCNLLNNAYPNKTTGSILAYGKTNAYELGVFLKTNADYQNFLWNKKYQEETYNYSFYGEEAGQGRSQALKEVYDLFYSLHNHNGLWKKTGKNAYASSDFKKNHLLFSIGSNSGFNYHLSKKENADKEVEEKDIFITISPYKYKNSSTGSSFISQGGSFFGISFNDPKIDHATRLFMKWLVGETKISNSSNEKNKVQYQTKGSSAQQVRPMVYYSLNGNYMPGFDDFIKDTSNKDKFMKGTSKQFVYELFTKLANAGSQNQSISNSAPSRSTRAAPATSKSNEKFTWGIKIPDVTKTKVFVEPVGELSGAFRAVTDSSESLGESQMPSFEEFWLRLKTNYQIQYWINRNKNLIETTKNKDKSPTTSTN